MSNLNKFGINNNTYETLFENSNEIDKNDNFIAYKTIQMFTKIKDKNKLKKD